MNLYTHAWTHTSHNSTPTAHTHTQNHLPCLSHQPDSFSLFSFSISLCLTLILDWKSPSKAQFADCVLQAGFVIVSLHINSLCLHLSFLPSLLPPLRHPPSLSPLQWEQSHWLNLWDKSCYPLNIKYQPFARSNTDKREGEWERERGRARGEDDKKTCCSPRGGGWCAIGLGQPWLPLLQWKDGGCVIMSKVKGPSSGLSCEVTRCGLKSQIINPNSK